MKVNPIQNCYRCGGLAENAVDSHIYIHGTFTDVPMCCDCVRMSLDNAKEFWRIIREKPKPETK